MLGLDVHLQKMSNALAGCANTREKGAVGPLCMGSDLATGGVSYSHTYGCSQERRTVAYVVSAGGL